MPKVLNAKQLGNHIAIKVIDAFANIPTVWHEISETENAIALHYQEKIVLITILVEKGE